MFENLDFNDLSSTQDLPKFTMGENPATKQAKSKNHSIMKQLFERLIKQQANK